MCNVTQRGAAAPTSKFLESCAMCRPHHTHIAYIHHICHHHPTTHRQQHAPGPGTAHVTSATLFWPIIQYNPHTRKHHGHAAATPCKCACMSCKVRMAGGWRLRLRQPPRALSLPSPHIHLPNPLQPPTQLSISPLNGKMVLSDAALAKTLVTVSNLSSNPGGVAFKVKTTKPRRYLVRPNQGILGPGERKEVAILMSSEKQAEAQKELEEHAVSDKFQVVYLSLSEVTYDGLKNAAEGTEQV